MRLDDVELDKTYFETRRKCFGRVVTTDPDDGACLLFEPLDNFGDIMGGDIFRTEACWLEPPTQEGWSKCFGSPGCLSFEEACGQ